MESLHSDLQRQVLLRVPYQFHENLRTVCRSWETMINSPQFYDDRKAYGKSEHLICLKHPCLQEITIYDPVKRTRERIPTSPNFPRFPDESQLVSVKGKLVLLGGIMWRPMPANTVFIYDFHSSKWRRGADMPTSRLWFACAVSSSKDFIYVAGGCNEHGDTLATAEVYDVEANKWEILPPMPQKRQGSLGVFMEGKFMVISGTAWNLQEFDVRTSAEIFDTRTNSWNTLEDLWSLEMRPLDCYLGFVSCGNFYVIDQWRKVMRKYDSHKNVWTPVPFFPQDIPLITCVAPWRDRVFVNGMKYPISYLFQPSTGESIAIDAGEYFAGYINVQAATVEI